MPEHRGHATAEGSSRESHLVLSEADLSDRSNERP